MCCTVEVSQLDQGQIQDDSCLSLLLGGEMWSETLANSPTLVLIGEEEKLPGLRQTVMNILAEQGFWSPERPSVGGWGL